jgi:hypothetical protein
MRDEPRPIAVYDSRCSASTDLESFGAFMHLERSRRRILAQRPLWRNYLVAYALVGVGFSLHDIAASHPRSVALSLAGSTILWLGLLVFAAAFSYSVWFVAGGKPDRQGDAHSDRKS